MAKSVFICPQVPQRTTIPEFTQLSHKIEIFSNLLARCWNFFCCCSWNRVTDKCMFLLPNHLSPNFVSVSLRTIFNLPFYNVRTNYCLSLVLFQRMVQGNDHKCDRGKRENYHSLTSCVSNCKNKFRFRDGENNSKNCYEDSLIPLTLCLLLRSL